MKQAKVYYNNIEAGMLWQEKTNEFVFEYHHDYFINPSYPAISKSILKNKKVHTNAILFPFFVNLLAQGSTKELQSMALHIQPNQYFDLLLQTASIETIGAITIKEITVAK